ncbi:MAG: DUF5677 domain-containing protein [Anaeroplasmataceae bacterium]
MQDIKEYIMTIEQEEKYINSKLDYEFSNTVGKEIVAITLKNFYLNTELVNNLCKIKGVSYEFILYNKLFKYKLMFVIISTHLFNLSDINETVYEKDLNYQNKLLMDVYYNLLNEDFTKLEISSLFLSNPAISNICSMLRIIYDNIKLDNDVISLQIKSIIESINAMVILLNNKCFSQAMSVFRQALEQYITVVALESNLNALPSFVDHQSITIKDATKSLTKEELDKYISDNNLTYNTYKSYMNYGWLDEVEAFKKLREAKPNTKYSIKTVALITDSMSFYDAMDFASNYVHSNFLFLNVNWDMVISEVLDGIYEIIDWIINIYTKRNNKLFIINGFDYLNLYKSLKEKSLRVISDEEYKFNIK